ncbi:hypothetical protein ACWCQW_49685 [Streptomyces mirabilis]
MDDGSKTTDTGDTGDEPEGRMDKLRQHMSEWQIREHVARGMAYGIGSGAVSLLILWAQTRY